MKSFDINGTTLSLALYADVTNSNGCIQDSSSQARDSLTTRTPHSELVYNYSGSKHITESLKRCGISDSTIYILAARFAASPDEIQAIENLVNGKEIDLEELEGRANQSQIQKHYKISAPELGVSSLADAIVCRIAARDAL
ncbi:hypothetical protein PHAVU_002G266500 [Phaseolus vulgaris]